MAARRIAAFPRRIVPDAGTETHTAQCPGRDGEGTSPGGGGASVGVGGLASAAAPGLEAYRNENYSEAYQEFEKTLKEHPNTHAKDKIEFDAGAAAYKMKDFNKALEWFSRSLLSKDKTLQQKSHYNIGRTLEERGDRAETNEKTLGDLYNAQSHYEEALKLNPNDERAKANLEEVKKKIERLKQNPKKQPTPPPQSQKDKKQQDQKQQPKDQQQKEQEKKDQDQQQNQDQSEGNDQQKQEKKDEKPGETPSPSPGDNQQQNQPGSSPSPSADKGSKGEKKDDQQPPSKGEQDASPSPSPSNDGEQSPSRHLQRAREKASNQRVLLHPVPAGRRKRNYRAR